jgi:aspartyl/asparaginyl-tRNA synthetase
VFIRLFLICDQFEWNRVPANNAIMRIKGGVSLLFREALSSVGFTEIVSPKILSGQSEGGSDVFKTTYFGKVRIETFEYVSTVALLVMSGFVLFTFSLLAWPSHLSYTNKWHYQPIFQGYLR